MRNHAQHKKSYHSNTSRARAYRRANLKYQSMLSRSLRAVALSFGAVLVALPIDAQPRATEQTAPHAATVSVDSSTRMLVIAPHPDDEVLAAGDASAAPGQPKALCASCTDRRRGLPRRRPGRGPGPSHRTDCLRLPRTGTRVNAVRARAFAGSGAARARSPASVSPMAVSLV